MKTYTPFKIVRIVLLFLTFGINNVYGAKGTRETYSSLNSDSVLVEVNGIKLTKGQYEGQIMAKLSFAKAKVGTIADHKFQMLKTRFREKEYQNFFPMALLASEAKRMNFVPTKEERLKLQEKYALSYGKKGMSFKQLCSFDKGVNCHVIEEMLELDLWSQHYIKTALATQMLVSAEAISNQVAQTIAYNARMVQTNIHIYAEATNVLARARAGADFSELADDFSQDEEKNPGGDLGFCTADDFSMEAPVYWESIVCLKPGEITDVMTTDDGIEIVKFLGDKEDVNGDGTVFARHLARIVWRTAIIFDEDPEFIKRELIKERQEEVIGNTIRDLRKKAIIKYPYGEGIVFPTRKRKK
ncbi:MAG: peptidylprolyl isomerase [Kiritimatiellae bacterium]|nr:peptidylprolyl isomerase [Kiritimatiellia bacterium]